MKKIWSIAWKVGLVVVLAALIFFVNNAHKRTQIKTMEIVVDYASADTLIDKQQLEIALGKEMGQITGKEINEVNLPAIEKFFRKNPYTADVNAYISLRGNLYIKVVQRKAILRVKALNNQEFYLDQKGHSFPLSFLSSSHVPVANGHIYLKWNLKNKSVSINELEKDSVWKESGIVNIFHLASFLDNNIFFKSQIDQIYLNGNDEFELVPKIGDQIILIGKVNKLEEKFEKLVALYKNGFSNIGWDLYKTIDLRFKDQVVCTKK